MVALVSPRIAHNLAKNGYYPTDDATTNAIISFFNRKNDVIRVLDPCIGEARAASNIAYSINLNAKLYGVEYNLERAKIAEKWCEVLLRSDLFDTVITPQSFGLLFLNPPYGNLTSEHNGAITNYQKDYKRLEKIFYRFAVPALQYNGILVLIIPYTQLDEMLSNWIANQFTDISVFTACDKQFKQLVIFGKKVRQNDISLVDKNKVKAYFKTIFEGALVPEEISITDKPVYEIPGVIDDIKSFYKLSFTDNEFDQEVQKIGGLWKDFDLFFKGIHQSKRQPLCQMSDWHLSLALAAGEINGVVSSESGKTYIIKGDTYKTKVKKVEQVYDDEESYTIQTFLTDRFVPSIKAWDMTRNSNTFGNLLIISTPSAEDNNPTVVQLGKVVMTPGIASLVADEQIDLNKYLAEHETANWGELSEHDARLNDLALKDGQKNGRLFSSYIYGSEPDDKVWIITEWHDDISQFVTTALLPDEY